MKSDEETLMDDVLDLVKNNMAAKIAEINTEKNDDITLEDIPADRYIETLNEDALNWPTFVYTGISDIESDGNGSATALTVTMFFDILFMDDQSGSTKRARKAVQRYTRAMREVIEENFRKITYASDLVVRSISPVDLRTIEDTNFYKVAGVQITTTIW